MNLLKNQRAADVPAGCFQDLEELLMANIVRHCRDYKQPIASDVWQMRKLAEIGALNRENIRIIARAAGQSWTAMERMLNDAAQEAAAELEPVMRRLVRRGLAGEAVSVKRSKNVLQVARSLKKQAKDVLNLCNTTMLYMARDAYAALVNNIALESYEIARKQEFLDVLGRGATAVVIGAESRQQALRKCIREFNRKGIPAFVDRRGREWTPEAYLNMAMRNTAKSVAEEVQTARCLDYGIRLIEISSHSGARPKCAKDQGKIYSLDNESGYVEDANGKKIQYYPWKSTSYGQPDGLLGINCTHHKYPFVPGISLQSYFPTEDLEANNKLYKETQVQRALERDIRKQKRECMLYAQLGDEEAFQKAAVKLKAKEDRLKQYVAGNGQLHRRRDREQVAGFDKAASSKAVAVNKSYTKKNVSGKMTVSEWSEETVKQRIEDEKNLKGLKQERAILYDCSGKNVFHKTGGKHSVSFTLEETKMMQGGVLTHNHPGGATFSPDDINMLRTAKLNEIRAVGRDGIYCLKQPSFWDRRIDSMKDIAEQYNKIVEELREEIEQWCYKNQDTITVEDYQIYYQHKVVEEFSRRFSIKYHMEVFTDERN